MYNRNFDASQITRRKGEKAVAGSFLSCVGTAPLVAIKDSSIIYSVKQGQMTQYTRYPACIGISPGCPCPELNESLISGMNIALPGPVTGITYTVGSIIVSWNAPTNGVGPYTYLVTPYLNGVAQSSVTTAHGFYRFTNLEEWQPYTFTVCAMNGVGQGPIVSADSSFIAPPNSLSAVIMGRPSVADPAPSLSYVIMIGLDQLMQYVASVNMGPTRGSRFMYVWASSIAQAWNWVSSDSRISGVHDNWNWNTKSNTVLSENDKIVWMCNVVDAIMPFFIPGPYRSMFNCNVEVANRVKSFGNWSSWFALWNTWFTSRQNDGSSVASTLQPVESANWNETIIVDGITINSISSYPAPQQWTRLTVNGKKQNYLTYTWDNVTSTCLTEENEAMIQSSVSPSTGSARDAEIDTVKSMAAILSDTDKLIAEFWAGGPGTVSPPLMFLWFWKEYVRTIDSVSCDNIIYSLLDLAIHLFEGGRVTWRLKKAHMEARPIQEIRRRYAGQTIASWNGNVDGAQWIPYQAANFITPPFADFPSGHSHFSKAFALTMYKWFGSTITKRSIMYDKQTLISPLFTMDQNTTYGTFVVPIGASEVQPGTVPSTPITLSFDTWDDMADSAGMSRLYGGIHALTAHTSSQSSAIQVDGYINSTWNILTTSPLVIPSNEPIIPGPVNPSSNDPVVPVNNPSNDPVAPVPTNPSNDPVAPDPVVPVQDPVQDPVISSNEPDVSIVEPYKIQFNYLNGSPSSAIETLFNQSKAFLESIIVQSHGLRLAEISTEYDMIVDVDMKSLGTGILASARPTIANDKVSPAMPLRQLVILNSDALHSSSLLGSSQLNGVSVTKLIPVLIHEMLHGLGIASMQTGYETIGWDQFLDASKTWYVGPGAKSEAIKAYQEIVGNQVQRIPVENSFGSGTAYSHWEEGINSQFQSDYRYYNYGSGNVFHPCLPDEIMTGVAGTSFYFTRLTAGALMDHGYVVDMNSSNIVSYPQTSLQKLV
jgi:hypothetical protein